MTFQPIKCKKKQHNFMQTALIFTMTSKREHFIRERKTGELDSQKSGTDRCLLGLYYVFFGRIGNIKK